MGLLCIYLLVCRRCCFFLFDVVSMFRCCSPSALTFFFLSHFVFVFYSFTFVLQRSETGFFVWIIRSFDLYQYENVVFPWNYSRLNIFFSLRLHKKQQKWIVLKKLRLRARDRQTDRRTQREEWSVDARLNELIATERAKAKFLYLFTEAHTHTHTIRSFPTKIEWFFFSRCALDVYLNFLWFLCSWKPQDAYTLLISFLFVALHMSLLRVYLFFLFMRRSDFNRMKCSYGSTISNLIQLTFSAIYTRINIRFHIIMHAHTHTHARTHART